MVWPDELIVPGMLPRNVGVGLCLDMMSGLLPSVDDE